MNEIINWQEERVWKWRMLVGWNWGNGRNQRKNPKIPTLPIRIVPLKIPWLELGTSVGKDKWPRCSYAGTVKLILTDHRYGVGVTSLLSTQRARVRSPFGSICWLRFFRPFRLNRKTNDRKFEPHSSPVIIWPPYTIRLRTAMVSDHGCR